MPYAKKTTNKSAKSGSYNKGGYNKGKSSYSKKVTVATPPIMTVNPESIHKRLTDEQRYLCEWLSTVFNQPAKLLTQAVPGAGKSSSIVHALYEAIKKEKQENKGSLVSKILMTSFAKRSTTDLIKKARSYGLVVDEKGKLVHKDVVIQGIHSFMYSLLRSWWSNMGCKVEYRDEYVLATRKVLSNNKYTYLILLGNRVNNHGTLVEKIATEYSTSEYFVRDEILRWINFMMVWLVDPNHPEYNVVTPKFIADKYNIAYKSNENMFNDMLDVAKAVMEEGFQMAIRRDYPQITYTEMLTVPYKLWQHKHLKMLDIVSENYYDTVICDEAQDFNVVQLKAVMDMIVNPNNPNSKVVMLGEDKQAIYGFQGSPNNMFSDFILGDYGFDEHRLTYSFRCAKKVVEYVSKIFPGIQAFPTNEEGELLEYYESEGLEKLQKDYQAYLDSIDNPDKEPVDLNPVTVLSRTNAPLIVFALECITRKIPVAFSKETGITGMLWGYYSTLKTFCSEYFKIDLDQNFEQLPELINRYYKTSVELFKDGYSGKKDVVNASEEYLEALKEDMEALRKCFFAFHGPDFIHVKSMDKLVEEIQPLLESTNPKVLLATIHTAKGLEWREVWLLQNLSGGYQVNNPRMTEDDKKQENHVYYVGCSRAQCILVHMLKDNQPRGLYLLGDRIVTGKQLEIS